MEMESRESDFESDKEQLGESDNDSATAGEEIGIESGSGTKTSNLNQEQPEYSYKHYYKFLRGDELVTCLTCNQQIKRGKTKSSKGMRVHLETKHPKLWKSYCNSKKEHDAQKKRGRTESNVDEKQKVKQQKLTDTFSVQIKQKWPPTNILAINIDNMILRYMCLSCEPLSLPDKPGFRDIFETAVPSYNLRGRNTFTDLFEQKYNQQHAKLVKLLEIQPYFSFTTDVWSNAGGKKSFLSLTVHFIDENFDRHFKVLSSEPIGGAHTALNIGQLIQNMLIEFNIQNEKVYLFLRDAGSALKKAVEDLEYPHFDCFIHKIQLAINDAIEHKDKCQTEVKTEIQKCRQLVALYNQSRTFREALVTRQKQLGLPENSLIQDTMTRWNSSFYMLKRIQELKDGILLCVPDFKNAPHIDFELVSSIIKVLEPFEKQTKMLESRYECISSILPCYQMLKHCLRNNPADSQPIQNLKQIVLDGLKTRMEQHLDQPFLVCATLLDPRYKNNANIFDEFSQRRNNINLKFEAEKMFVGSHSPRNASDSTQNIEINLENDDPMASFLNAKPTSSDLIEEPIFERHVGTEIDEEIKKFFEMKCESHKSDPLLFWKNNDNFPSLKKMALKFLSAPPSTSESERVFSTMGEIYSSKRSRLSMEHAKMQLFLHHNFDI